MYRSIDLSTTVQTGQPSRSIAARKESASCEWLPTLDPFFINHLLLALKLSPDVTLQVTLLLTPHCLRQFAKVLYGWWTLPPTAAKSTTHTCMDETPQAARRLEELPSN